MLAFNCNFIPIKNASLGCKKLRKLFDNTLGPWPIGAPTQESYVCIIIIGIFTQY